MRQVKNLKLVKRGTIRDFIQKTMNIKIMLTFLIPYLVATRGNNEKIIQTIL